MRYIQVRLAQFVSQTNTTLMSAQCLERSRSRFWNRASVTRFLVLLALLTMALPVRAGILWSDPDSRVIHATPVGVDILGGAVKRDDKANDALYFKFRVDPLSDLANEPYYAVFQLMEGDKYRLAVGNAPEAWGYSACFTSETQTVSRVAGEFDLNSSQPEAAGLGIFKPYELPHHDQKRTIIFKVQYVPGGDDLITVAQPEPGPRARRRKIGKSHHEIGERVPIKSAARAAATAGSSATWQLRTRFATLSGALRQRWWFLGLTTLALDGAADCVRIERENIRFAASGGTGTHWRT
jgi:hypothetical protein